MKNFVVLYRVKFVMAPADPPFGFQCYADSADHAEEQCINAEPSAEVVWVWQGSPGVGMQPALDEYWAQAKSTSKFWSRTFLIGHIIGPVEFPVEFRLYPGDVTLDQFDTIRLAAKEELLNAWRSFSDHEITISSNRAGLHFAAATWIDDMDLFTTKMKEIGWKEA